MKRKLTLFFTILTILFLLPSIPVLAENETEEKVIEIVIQDGRPAGNSGEGWEYTITGTTDDPDMWQILDLKAGYMFKLTDGAGGEGTYTGTNMQVSGTIIGGIFRNQNIINIEDSGIIMGGTFQGNGNIHVRGTIADGSFESPTINMYTTISGGSFSGKVYCREGAITGGTFSNKVTIYSPSKITQAAGQDPPEFTAEVKNQGTIEAGTFTEEVENSQGAVINNGTFHGTVSIDSSSTINNGIFYGFVNNDPDASIIDGTFYGGLSKMPQGWKAVTVNTNGGTNGTLSQLPKAVKPGTALSLTVTPNPGNHAKVEESSDSASWYDKEAILSFSMPDYDIAITVTFEAHSFKTLTWNDLSHWYICDQCSAKSDAQAKPHQFNSWTFSDADKHQKSCSCGYSQTAAHSGGQATCTALAICTDCQNPYGKIGEHSLIHYDEVAPTTETTGIAAHDECSTCHKLFQDGKEVNEDTLLIPELKPDPTPEPDPETKPDPDPETDQETKPAPSPEPDQETKPDPSPEPDQETKPDPSPEPDQETKPDPSPEPGQETKPDSTPEPEQEVNPDTAPGLKAETKLDTEKELDIESETISKKKPDSNPSPQTGDNSILGLWVMILLLSGSVSAGIAAVNYRNKK